MACQYHYRKNKYSSQYSICFSGVLFWIDRVRIDGMHLFCDRTDVQYHKKGIGSKIIKDTCEYLKMLGYKRVRLGVDKGNPQSIAFWQKNHFAVISEDNYILMELPL